MQGRSDLMSSDLSIKTHCNSVLKLRVIQSDKMCQSNVKVLGNVSAHTQIH